MAQAIDQRSTERRNHPTVEDDCLSCSESGRFRAKKSTQRAGLVWPSRAPNGDVAKPPRNHLFQRNTLFLCRNMLGKAAHVPSVTVQL
jgi:hypothetical protein